MKTRKIKETTGDCPDFREAKMGLSPSERRKLCLYEFLTLETAMTTQSDLNTPLIAVIGLLGAILVFAIIVLLIVVFYRVETRQQAELSRQPPTEISNLMAEQQAKLVQYRWVNQQQRIVSIPIHRAMDLVVAELGRDAQSADDAPSPSEKKGGENGP